MRRSVVGVFALVLVVMASVGSVVTPAQGVDESAQGSAATDRAVLEAFYDATGGASWTNSTNWKTSAPLGDWHGVTADAGGRVTKLFLDENALTGPIPVELGRLVNLEWLSLAVNDLTGPIPVELGSLVNLERLFLNVNDLNGRIPVGLGSLANLEVLNLGGNALTGSIPAALGSLANLEVLNLDGNALTGPIPAALGSLANLAFLDLRGNELTGPIPAALGSLENLEVLDLLGNELTGPIPALGSNLVVLFLGGNEMTGPIPAALGSLENLEILDLRENELTGPIPAALGSLTNLLGLWLGSNDLTSPIPAELGNLENLEWLDLSYNWGLSGPLPAGLETSSITRLDIFATRTCAPDAWQDWLETIELFGPLCEAGTDVTIDVAVIYTPAAREAAGGAAALEAVIDLMVAETNQAYAASGVHQRLALVARSEVPYRETGVGFFDLRRLRDPSDGRLDEVHDLRDRVGADLVHLIVARSNVCGIAYLQGVFGLTASKCGGWTFAHELGHNMGLQHDRFEVNRNGELSPHPAYGYVNQRAFAGGAPVSSRWRTIMSYPTQCIYNGSDPCRRLLRYSNPRQRYAGDPLGVAYGAGGSGVDGPADAASVLNATGPAVAARRDRVRGANQPPTVMRALPDRKLPALGSVLEVDVSSAFVDPDRDRLRYTVSSSAPHVATVLAAGRRVTQTAVGVGASAIRVTATDPGGLSVTQSFRVTVTETGTGVAFADDPIVPGVTPVKEIHITELRLRVDALRVAAGLARFAWTDRVLSAGVTAVRLVHLLELRSALAAAYAAEGRGAPSWTDAAPVAGSTLIRAVHLMELRAAVVALE